MTGRPTHSDDGTKADQVWPGRCTKDETRTIAAHAEARKLSKHGAAQLVRQAIVDAGLLEPIEMEKARGVGEGEG